MGQQPTGTKGGSTREGLRNDKRDSDPALERETAIHTRESQHKKRKVVLHRGVARGTVII